MKTISYDKNEFRNFDEKELEILRSAVDKANEESASKIAQSEKVRNITEIVEKFLYDTKLICYGGTAINNILPVKDQFYNKNIDIPDYDFFSPNALNDAMRLADIYHKKGYSNVQAKTGIHEGTFKVYADFLQVADITQMPKNLFDTLKKHSISIYGILYAPVNFLRMSMYLELSRPMGDVSRWEKVLKRLILLNKNYPINNEMCNEKKLIEKFNEKKFNKKDSEIIFNTIKETGINTELIFFGNYAIYLYSKYMPDYIKRKFKKSIDFNMLSNNPFKSVIFIKERLTENGIKNVKFYKKKGVGEIIPEHYQIKVNNKNVAFVYQTTGCHNYNEINKGDKLIKVATIDTILSFYYAFMYGDRDYYDINKLICLTQFLFIIQYKNRLNQKGLLKRFVLSLLKNNKDSYEFKKLFLKYYPENVDKTDKKKDTKSIKNKRKKSSKSKKSIKNKSIKSKSKKSIKSKSIKSKKYKTKKSKSKKSKTKKSKNILNNIIKLF
jgi:hypothetical protein